MPHSVRHFDRRLLSLALFVFFAVHEPQNNHTNDDDDVAAECRAQGRDISRGITSSERLGTDQVTDTIYCELSPSMRYSHATKNSALTVVRFVWPATLDVIRDSVVMYGTMNTADLVRQLSSLPFSLVTHR